MNMHPQGGVANRDQQPNAGVDVCKQHLDACLGTAEQRVVNDASGWDELIAKFKDANVDLVVVEATGGYERGLVCALQGAGIAVARVNPRHHKRMSRFALRGKAKVSTQWQLYCLVHNTLKIATQAMRAY
jgi:transposase